MRQNEEQNENENGEETEKNLKTEGEEIPIEREQKILNSSSFFVF